MSNYAAFDVVIEHEDGTREPAALVPVHVFDVDGATALADLAADANGHVAAGSLTVAPGTTIRFWSDLNDGRVGFSEVLTTA